MFQLKLILIGLMSLRCIHGMNNIVNCYIGNAASYRDGDEKFKASHINPNLCTHLSYDYFGIDDDGAVKILDVWLDLNNHNIEKIVALKEINPKLKVMLVVGGLEEGSSKYSTMALDPQKRKKFIDTALMMINDFKCDGLVLDWEFPARGRGSTINDKQNFVILLKEIYEELHQWKLEFSISVGGSVEEYDKSYNIREISMYVDYINVMAYNFSTPADKVVGYNAPLKGQGQNNVEAAIKYWLGRDAPASKLVLGLPFFGHNFILSNPNQFSLGSPSNGANNPGGLEYNKICAKKNDRWSYEWINESSVPILHNCNELISYDDVKSIEMKVDLSRSLNLAGVMIWSIEMDDFHGKCGDGKFPLLEAVNKKMMMNPQQAITHC